MSTAELTGITGVLLSAIALVILPLWFKRQTRKQSEQVAEKQAIKEQAERDAKSAEGEVVSWEKINQRLTATAESERAAHQMRLAELRESFADEVQRTKRQSDYELDRAKQEINRLADRVEELTRQIIALGSKSER